MPRMEERMQLFGYGECCCEKHAGPNRCPECPVHQEEVRKEEPVQDASSGQAR